MKTEKSIIENTPSPRTRSSIAHDLRQLGVTEGMILVVHAAMSALGWINGGPIAVIQALQDVLTPSGTLIMPAHSGEYSDPAEWQNPPIPKTWHQEVRDSMPAFDPAITPTRSMGRIAEAFRSWPNVRRSNHPHLSFAAWGKRAEEITAVHPLTPALEQNSPLGRVYALGGYVLLMGVGFGNNTSFHMAEYAQPNVKMVKMGAPVMENGRRLWKQFEDIDFDEDDFPRIGEAFEKAASVINGKVGSADCKLFYQPAAVNFAIKWMKENR